MNTLLADRIFNMFDIGSLNTEPTPVSGGLIHRMFRCETNNGTFALKIIDSQIANTPGIRESLDRGEQIAAAFSDAGVPAVVALNSRQQGRVVETANLMALVFPWIEGRSLRLGAAGAESGRQIGQILGTMHSIDLCGPITDHSLPGIIDTLRWRNALDRGIESGAEWCHDMTMMGSIIEECQMRADAAAKSLGNGRVISHGDLDSKNVLWHQGEPFIIDWESAGPVQPAVEALCAALDWSWVSPGVPGRATFAAILEGYRSRHDLSQRECQLALDVVLGRTLDWLYACMERSLDPSRSPEDRAIRTTEVIRTSIQIRSAAENSAAWLKWT